MLDKSKKEYLDAVAERLSQHEAASYKVQPYHVHFWKADYTMHSRPDFSFNVRTVSNRTLRTESGNDENLFGNFLPDGATDIQRSGKEYNNIQPIWEWDKIPGVTNRDYPGDAGADMKNITWGAPGTTAFAGGVSDSTYGVTAYDLNFDSVTAKKAWFFFDKEVVCLGAGINSNAPENITTTINQCWLNGDIKTSSLTSEIKDNSITTLKNTEWVWHDSIGYFFPNGGNIYVSDQMQTGEWYRINKAQPKGEVKGKVFKLWIDHNATPVNESYAYIVVPGLNNKKAIRSYNTSAVTIEMNSSQIQAVKHNTLDILQVVFYKAGELKTSYATIKADKPCIIYIKNISSTKPELFIADPTQQNNNIHLSIQLGKNTIREMDCLFPLGVYAGQSAKFLINKN